VIYDKKQHEPLAGGAWDARRAGYAIADIVDAAVAGGPPGEAGIYAGVAGEIFALRTLGSDVDWEIGAGDGLGYVEGEVGVALVTGDVARLRAAAPAVIDDPFNELLYGVAGALVAAVALNADDVVAVAVERLWNGWTYDPELRACIWTQVTPQGVRGQILGMAHGAAGNAYALLRAAGFQSAQHQSELLERIVELLDRTALRDGRLANWPPRPGDPAARLRVQWCHGAPGIVCALAGTPAHRELDAILLAAGELTWTAGPLRKGPGLCHGTAGNGYAFLKLFRRTRDPKWLERARRFAMHSLGQLTGERGLYEGDLGVALYLRACIDVDDRWPLLDVS